MRRSRCVTPLPFLLLLLLLLCVLSSVVSGAVVQTFRDRSCTVDTGAGVISGVPTNKCSAVSAGTSGSLRLSCSDASIVLQLWKQRHNSDCEGQPQVVAASVSTPPSNLECIPLSLDGAPTEGSVRIDCNDAQRAAASGVAALAAVVAAAWSTLRDSMHL